MIYRLGELFCGPGGIGLGAGWARVSNKGKQFSIAHAWANDYDPQACQTYRNNLVPEHPERVICGPVQKLDFDQLPTANAITFGFPCNDFSLVGEHKGLDGHFGGLYQYGVKAVQHFQPDFFIAENVTGLQSANSGLAFSLILNELSDAGYTITAHEYRFEEYGVPQKRHRILIVGIRDDLGLTFQVPYPTTRDHYVSAEIALKGALEVPYNNELTNHAARVIEMLSHLKPGENAWSTSLPPHLRLNVKGAKLSQIYKRLEPDKPSYTVTGSGGGGTHMYHWQEPRALTNRERARLQSFPDDYVFFGSKEQVRKQIGMAVPPLAAKQIFEAVLKTLARVPYPSIEPNIHFDNQTDKVLAVQA